MTAPHRRIVEERKEEVPLNPKRPKEPAKPPVLRERSLLSRIYLLAGLAVFLFVSLWTMSAVLWLSTESVESLDHEADRQATELSLALAPILWGLDEKSIQAILDTKTQNPEFTSITVKDTSMGQVWTSPELPRPQAAWQVERRSPIVYNGKSIAQLTLVLNSKTWGEPSAWNRNQVKAPCSRSICRPGPPARCPSSKPWTPQAVGEPETGSLAGSVHNRYRAKRSARAF